MTMISVKGLYTIEKVDEYAPLLSISDNLSWLKRNIDIMELGLRSWDERDIDDPTLCIIMYEGLDKVKAFLKEIEKATGVEVD